MPRRYDYKFPDVTEDNKIALIPFEIEAMSILLGLLEPLAWSSRYATQEDYERGLAWLECFRRRVVMACRDFNILGQLEQMLLSGHTCCAAQANPFAPVSPVSPDTEGPPQQEDPPGSYESWEEYFGVKCDTATSAVRAAISGFTKLSEWVDDINGIVVVPLLAEALEALLLSASVIATIAAALIGALAQAIVENLAERLEELEAELVCAVFNADDVAQAKANWFAVLDTHVEDPIEKIILQNLFPTTIFNSLFSGDPIWHGLPLVQGDCTNCYEIDPSFVVYTRHTFPYDMWILGEGVFEEKGVFNGFRLRKSGLTLEPVDAIFAYETTETGHFGMRVQARSFFGYVPATVEFRRVSDGQLLETLGSLPLTNEWVWHEFETSVAKPPGAYFVRFAPNIGTDNNGWVRSLEIYTM